MYADLDLTLQKNETSGGDCVAEGEHLRTIATSGTLSRTQMDIFSLDFLVTKHGILQNGPPTHFDPVRRGQGNF
jgi:hypothetical protein